MLVTPGILIGGGALMRHGWTTQIHRIEEFAIPPGGRVSGPDRWRLLERPWTYLSVLESLSVPEGDFLVASPEAALADAILHRSDSFAAWCPDPDDIDPDELSGNHMPALIHALHALGATDEVMCKARDSYGQALDSAAPAPCFSR